MTRIVWERKGIYWYASLDGRMRSEIPWWLGVVEPIELTWQMTVIPFNLVIAWGRLVYRGVLYQWTPHRRWRYNRRAIRMAVERGRRAGFNQGMAHEACNPRFGR